MAEKVYKKGPPENWIRGIMDITCEGRRWTESIAIDPRLPEAAQIDHFDIAARNRLNLFRGEAKIKFVATLYCTINVKTPKGRQRGWPPTPRK